MNLRFNLPLSRNQIGYLGLLAVLIAAVYLIHGDVFLIRVLVEAGCYAMLALGLSLQWGYAGLFNAGIMGFIAIGGLTSVSISFAPNPVFLNSEYPWLLLLVIVIIAAALAGIYLLVKLSAWPPLIRKLAGILLALIIITTLVWANNLLAQIEQEIGFIGGLGLSPLFAWLVAGAIAALLAFAVGKLCLGLRSDYMAISTLAAAEIIRTLLKNTDWLTNGIITVAPLPWPVPHPQQVGFLQGRGFFLLMVVALLIALCWLLHRQLNSPWGRMLRAIRDDETAAATIGKNIIKQKLTVFVFGSIIMGVAGSMLITFYGIFDPSSFQPLNHTFLIWVMVILGGAGRNIGAIFGAIVVYLLWSLSDQLALYLFEQFFFYGDLWFDLQPPNDLVPRALQMRAFVTGAVILLILRFAPTGLFPEVPVKYPTTAKPG